MEKEKRIPRIGIIPFFLRRVLIEFKIRSSYFPQPHIRSCMYFLALLNSKKNSAKAQQQPQLILSNIKAIVLNPGLSDNWQRFGSSRRPYCPISASSFLLRPPSCHQYVLPFRINGGSHCFTNPVRILKGGCCGKERFH